MSDMITEWLSVTPCQSVRRAETRHEPPVEFWGKNLVRCGCCADVLPVTSTVTVGDRDTARDLRVEIGDEVCLTCYGC